MKKYPELTHIKGSNGIYQCLCLVTNKYYFGSTKNGLYSRCKSHITELSDNTHGNRYLQNAWNLHGKQSFVWCVIETYPITVSSEELRVKEFEYIAEFKSLQTDGCGYNIAPQPDFKPSRSARPVVQYTIDGVFVKRWNGASEIKRETGWDVKECLYHPITHHTLHNFRWCFEDRELTIYDRKPPIPRIHKQRGKRNKPILQYTIDGVFVKKWHGIYEITTTLNWSVRDCLIGKFKQSHGFTWRYT